LKRQIDLLVQLQRLANAMRDLNERKQAGPARLQELEDRFQATLEDIGAARLRYETLERELRQLEADLQDLDAKLEKYQQQLMSVTNAREYSAALNEIDAAKTAKERAEEGILTRSAEEEELSDAVAEADSRIAAARATTDAEKEQILQELSEVDDRLDTLARERTQVEADLDPELVSQFKRVFAARGGIAMARVENGACSACHLRLRPQVINEVRKGMALVPCDSCRRFLFIEENEQPGQPTPGAEAAAETSSSV
jgi:predicted  nucleic acid-binding Zn-ribbon protein